MMRYYIKGAYYPKGGSHRIAEAIIPTIEKAGGRVLCRAKVLWPSRIRTMGRPVVFIGRGVGV